MGKIISVGIQKGGSAKTTTTAILAHILSQNHKVLAVDMDSQGNLTEMLTGVDDIYEFSDRTILEAMKERDASNYIHKINDKLHIIPSNDLLATFANYLYSLRGKGFNLNKVLSETLSSVRDQYDFILIDTPPALGEQTINSLCASDYVIVMFETSKFCHSALSRFFETLDHCREKVNPNIKVAGLLRTLIDNRRTDNKLLIKQVEEEYGDVVFDTVITRTASVGRISIMGFVDNPELSTALGQYKDFTKELLQRVQ